ncbi:MAG: hypothetical protein AB7O24_24985 [Kofleriaceae bacterium]
MRVACVHIPQFALQTLTRVDPTLRGAAVAVVGATGSDTSGPDGGRAALHSPIVQACSRAAWALGVRTGMTAAAAHGLAPGQLRVVTADPKLERETVRAIADALLGVAGGSTLGSNRGQSGAPLVDVGGRVGTGAHLAMYCEVPTKTRGSSYGDRLLEILDVLGVTGRIGIADDRFTAWVAAAHGGSEERGVISVPRGGSAAFLAPRPLALLGITPEVQHMLEALGVATLGEFAALPAPSVARPLEADYQALARGDGGALLRPYAPEAPVREELVELGPVDPVAGTMFERGTTIERLAERIALRLAGRGRGAVRFEVEVITPSGENQDRFGEPGRVLETATELTTAIGDAVRTIRGSSDSADTLAQRIRVTVIGEAIAGAGEELAADVPTPANDMLGVVLTTTGSPAVWQLAPPSGPSGSTAHRLGERRDAYRRTRRGKHQRRRTLSAGGAQRQLFK